VNINNFVAALETVQALIPLQLNYQGGEKTI